MNDIIIIQQPASPDKLEALKAFLKALKIKFEVSQSMDIPEEHKNLVRERIKNSKEEDLLDWDQVKDDFDGI